MRELVGAYRRGSGAAREELVHLYLPLVRGIARRHATHSESLEDLVQVGSIGLILAIDRFDPERGADLLAFALPSIAGEIKRHLRDRSSTIRVPRRVQQLDPGATHRARMPLSLSAEPDAVPAADGDDYEAALARALLTAGARALDGRERRIVLLHHFAGLSQREVAGAVGISQIHVSRLYREALTKLRAEIGEEAA